VVEEAVVRSWRRSRRRRRAASLLDCSLLFVWGVSSGLRDGISEKKRRRRQRRRRRRRRISGFNNCIEIFSAPLAVETVEVIRYDACK
jgi:hypothetical protein